MQPTPTVIKPTESGDAENRTISSRDQLLIALKSAPRLSQEDAQLINQVVQEAREASIGDQLTD